MTLDPELLDIWRRTVGAANVETDAAALALASTATFATTPGVPAIVRPGNRAEVEACVRVAARHGTPLYPVSRGRNWGYGSRVPPRDGSILLELGRLDRIVEHDEELAYVTVQPGVTFRQLHQFLRARRSRLMLCPVASTPDASIIGNILERGIGNGPYADRLRHVCGLEVVTPTGEVLRTGAGRWTRAQAARVHPWGTGPALDGLFTQASFGIVTELTLWLLPLPEIAQVHLVRIDRPDGLGPVIDELRHAVLAGILRPGASFYNDLRAASFQQRFPWAELGEPPLTPAYRATTRARFGAWSGSIVAYPSSARHAALIRDELDARLGPWVSELRRVEASGDELVQLIEGRAPERPGAGIERFLLEVAVGVPSERGLAAAYWRKRRLPDAASLHPDRDRCGVLWCAPAVPMLGVHTRRVSEIVEQLVAAHGFEPMISFQCITERCIYAIVPIFFDRDVPGEDARALACYRQLAARLTEAGFPPYRQIVASEGASVGASVGASEGAAGAAAGEALPPFEAFVARMKAAVDPAHILAPGRYEAVCRPPGGEDAAG
jgi:4-cresol dehydrogenase (hydroxylating)